MKTLVIGVGNILRCDDGVGVHIVNRLREEAPQLETLDAALGSVELLEAMKGYDRVFVLDAAETGGEPGTVYRVDLIEGGEPPALTHSHGIDVLTTLRLGEALYGGEMPGEVILMAIEAEDVTTLRETCTERVEEAIGRVVKEIVAITSAGEA